MAKRGEGGSGGKKSKRGFLSWILSSGARRTLFALAFFFLGGLVFNLDRLGNTGVTLLKFKNYLPRSITRFLPGGTAQEGSATANQRITGQIIEVYDGDTATLLTPENVKYKVRFYGIDAPEAAQEGGIDSRDVLREKILGKEVVVIVAATDRYGRAVGKVMLGDRCINREMVAEGRAWYYKNYAPNEYDFAQAEAVARRDRRGIWKAASPQPPWEWRRENKKE